MVVQNQVAKLCISMDKNTTVPMDYSTNQNIYFYFVYFVSKIAVACRITE